MLSVSDIQAVVCPLWAVSPKVKHPWTIGSGVFIEAQGERLILTAAPVMDEFNRHPIGVAGRNEKLMQLSGLRFARNPVAEGQTRLDDQYDLGGIFLDGLTAEGLSDSFRFLKVDDVEVTGRTAPESICLIAGFPDRRAAASHQAVVSECMHAKSLTVPDSKYREGYNHRHHLLFDFDLRGWHCEKTGRKVTLCNLEGVSGGGVFRQIDTPDGVTGYKLAGITTEHHPHQHLLVATRADYILKQIYLHFQDRWGTIGKKF